MFNSAVSSVQPIRNYFRAAHIQEHVSTTSKVAHIQEHVLSLHDLTMLNSAMSYVQHNI
jgi:hypothetical protein